MEIFIFLAQAFITNESLTEQQYISSIPNSLNLLKFFSKPGNCCEEHVGVKAPGRLKRITLLPLKKSSVVLSSHFPPIAQSSSLNELSPSLILKVTFGILNPLIMIIL